MGKLTDYLNRLPNIGITPHAYGENLKSPSLELNLLESPPRIWGKLSGAIMLGCAVENHPHAYGENPKESLIDQRPSFINYQFFFSL